MLYLAELGRLGKHTQMQIDFVKYNQLKVSFWEFSRRFRGKKKILNMSVHERKRLGINKSTLWYQKRKLTTNKKIKLYNKVLSRIRG